MTISPEAWEKILDRVESSRRRGHDANLANNLREYFFGKYYATIETVADVLGVHWQEAEDKIRVVAVARSLMK